MLSRTSFKAELVTYRANMRPPKKPGDTGPLGRGNLNTADVKIIERWIEDLRAEEIWSALKRRSPHAEPTSFIKIVLFARRSADSTIARTTSFKAQWETKLAGLKRQIARLQQSAGPLAIAATLDDAAADLRELHAFHFDSNYYAKYPLSRKDQGGSRRRRLFMQIMGDYFTREYGAPLDDHAATLAEIALADHELQRDHARNARRPTTRRARIRKRRGGAFRGKKPG